MRILKQLTTGVAFAFCLTAATQLHAQSIKVRLAVQQSDYQTNNGVITDRIFTTKLASTDFLWLIADAYPTNFPDGFPFGAQLVLVNYEYFQVQAADGSILLTNISDVLTYSDTFNDGDVLYRGKVDTNTGAINETYYCRATIHFDDHLPDGIRFTFTGTLQEKAFTSAADSDGYHLNQDSWTLNGTGEGHVGSDFFILSGKFVAPTVKWYSQDP